MQHCYQSVFLVDSDTSIDTVLTTDSFPRDTRTDDDEEVLLIDSGPQALPYCTGYQVTVPTMNDALKISSHVDMKFGELVYVADDEESYRHGMHNICSSIVFHVFDEYFLSQI